MAELITASGSRPQRASAQYLRHKAQLHRALIARLEADNLSIDDWSEARLRQWIAQQTQTLVARERLAVNASELRQLGEDILHELVGFGPLQPLIEDP